jgi:hypothetical protein
MYLYIRELSSTCSSIRHAQVCFTRDTANVVEVRMWTYGITRLPEWWKRNDRRERYKLLR